MGVMQKLREQTHAILWGVLILFVLSMTVGGLVGGADVLNIFSDKNKNPNITGKINDTEIKIRQFSEALNYQVQRLRNQGQEVDSRTMDMVSDRVWNSMVNEVLISEVAKEYGFIASDEEIYESLVSNPPAMFRQHPQFQTDGQFDHQKYLDALHDPSINWLPFEQQIRNQLPMTKVVNFVQSLATISESDIRNEFAKTSIKYSIEALSVPISKVNKEDITVSESEIEKRYKNNKEDYLQEETRDLKYVSFEIKPSKRDTLSAKNFANDLFERIQKGEDFKTVATEYTEDPSGQENGGDLGWFAEGRMVKPFSDACFNADKGDLVGPILTRFGYHIIKVEDFREKDGTKEAKARHILLKIKTGPETQNAINSTANLFAYDANEYGFEAAADSYDVEIQTADKLSKDSRYINRLGFIPSAPRFAFSDVPIGEISKLYSTENSFVIFKLANINKEHYQKLEDVKESIENQIVKEKREETLKTISDKYYNEAISGKTLREIANNDDNLSFTKIDTTTLDKPLNGLGKDNKIVGTILALDEGETAPPVFVGNKDVIVKLVKKSAFDDAAYADAKEDIRKRLLNSKKSSYYGQWIQSLRDKATIVDNRDRIF